MLTFARGLGAARSGDVATARQDLERLQALRDAMQEAKQAYWAEQAEIQRPDPVMFLGYWNNPQATTEKFVGDWACTGDLARKDEEGYFWFVGRKDDLISSGGYRIGPGEIEDCLAGHAAVTVAAVVGSPDAVRGEIVKAFVQLREGQEPSPALARELAAYVRTRLSAHEYPREIEFIAELPMTTTGKVRRRRPRTSQ